MNILHYAVNLQLIDNIVIHDSKGLMSLANESGSIKNPALAGFS